MGKAIGADVTCRVIDTHAVLELPEEKMAEARAALKADHPQIRVMSAGEVIEIYKEVGLPGDVAKRFDIPKLTGTHGIGHTRMATESAVTTLGAHPFSTGADQCLVHNGSLSVITMRCAGSWRVRASRWKRENDTEVAAAYLTWKMQQGA